jgi:DNA-binding transcriptional ArsR family regulator
LTIRRLCNKLSWNFSTPQKGKTLLIKVKKTILELLRQEKRWWSQVDIISVSLEQLNEQVKQDSTGVNPLKRVTIRVHLIWLLDHKLIKSREENDEEFQARTPRQPRGRMYKITKAGIQAYADMS